MKQSFASEKATVWVTGATGLIGHYVVETAPRNAPEFRIFAPSHQQLDLTNRADVERAFQREQPVAIIHCAALSKAPACQANPELARRLNVDVTQMLADLATSIQLLLCSTDFVFDGQKGNYVETDPTAALTVYAETKIAAEKIVLSNPRHTVIRLSLNYGHSVSGDRSFNEEMFSKFKQGQKYPLFIDEFRCPIPADITARVIWELIQQGATGLFHVAGTERLSRYEIGELLVHRHPQYKPLLQPVSLKTYQGPPRAPDTSLNCAKVQKLLSFTLPRFSDWLKENQVR